MQMFMVIDVDSCWGCKSCTVSCKNARGLLPGEDACLSIFRIENLDDRDDAVCDFVPVMCQQCSEPECLVGCPKSAISRNSDGLVVIDSALCIGCGKCARQCPYGAISVKKRAEGGKLAYKCDLCAERRALGGMTACEQHCPGKVFSCVDEKTAREIASKRRYSFGVGHVIYVSDILSNLGSVGGNR